MQPYTYAIYGKNLILWLTQTSWEGWEHFASFPVGACAGFVKVHQSPAGMLKPL